MPVCRSSGARETWVIEYYKHPAPLALRSDDADSNDLLFAQPSIIFVHLLHIKEELAMSQVSRRELLLLSGAALVGAAATETKAKEKIASANPGAGKAGGQEEAYMAIEFPIEIVPGVYTTPGQPEIMGLCIVIDNQETNWEVIRTEQYGTTIKIKNGSIWNVQEYVDPNTGKQSLEIFRAGGKLNYLVLEQFIHLTEDVYTPNGNAAENELPMTRIFYSV
jgi:hypothetical protein